MEIGDTYLRVTKLLNESDVNYTIHDYGAKRVADVPEDLPIPTESLVKTLVFQVNRTWLLVAVKAKDRVDYRKLADACGVSRSAITSPPPEAVEAALGVEIGGVCPFPLIDQARVILDQNVIEADVIFCGVGRIDKTLEIKPQDLLRLSAGQVLGIVRG